MRETTDQAETTLRWLEGTPEALAGGVTWGVPWPRGTLAADTAFAMLTGDGREVPVQSWATAVWPDGSLKWSAHAAAPQRPEAEYRLIPGRESASGPGRVSVTASPQGHFVDTGAMRAAVPSAGPVLVTGLERGGRIVAKGGRLISELARDPEGRERTAFEGRVESVTVEQDGPVRAVLLVTGRHTDGERSWLPFRVRLYFHAGSDQIRIVHTLVWDGDPERDFLCGLGLRFDVPMRGQAHDRHVRIAGSEGFLTEAVRPLTGIWSDVGDHVRRDQVAGRAVPAFEDWNAPATRLGRDRPWERLVGHIPKWSDWTLSQLSADGYTMRKRTGPGHGWVPVPSGTRSRGYAYAGSPDGGLEVGLRGFWQSHPTQIDVRDAATDTAALTVWLHSPEAQPMDVRFYHDGANAETAADQIETVEVTYEDYRPGYGDASGVARTHELLLRAAEATADHEGLDARATACATPPQLVCEPERYRAAEVFGAWSVPNRDSPNAAAIEDRLTLLTDYYIDQVEQRRWYGFWDFGDVMHTYDYDRHTWRYDIGGYAWDNSELSTDLWLWLSFLRTGDAGVYRLAEAMTRHTGEVDVYHSGRFAGFGTRHNVQHWGCSCKQLRVSSAVYRRFMYFLTADERIGELLDEVAPTARTMVDLDRSRMAGARGGERPLDEHRLEVDLGIDYGALLAGWLTRWERTGDPEARERIVGTMTDIGRMPNRYFTGIGHYDNATGRFQAAEPGIRISHLSAVFGIVEVVTEILDLVEVPEFEAAWLDYCRYYLAPAQEQTAIAGETYDGGLKLGHTRLLAWAANRLGDRALAERAWRFFLDGPGDRANLNGLDPAAGATIVTGPAVAEAVTELPNVGTNDAAQYGLAAIQNLALIGDSLDEAHESPGGS